MILHGAITGARATLAAPLSPTALASGLAAGAWRRRRLAPCTAFASTASRLHASTSSAMAFIAATRLATIGAAARVTPCCFAAVQRQQPMITRSFHNRHMPATLSPRSLSRHQSEAGAPIRIGILLDQRCGIVSELGFRGAASQLCVAGAPALAPCRPRLRDPFQTWLCALGSMQRTGGEVGGPAGLRACAHTLAVQNATLLYARLPRQSSPIPPSRPLRNCALAASTQCFCAGQQTILVRPRAAPGRQRTRRGAVAALACIMRRSNRATAPWCRPELVNTSRHSARAQRP